MNSPSIHAPINPLVKAEPGDTMAGVTAVLDLLQTASDSQCGNVAIGRNLVLRMCGDATEYVRAQIDGGAS